MNNSKESPPRLNVDRKHRFRFRLKAAAEPVTNLRTGLEASTAKLDGVRSRRGEHLGNSQLLAAE
jgi:hypothetical protein